MKNHVCNLSRHVFLAGLFSLLAYSAHAQFTGSVVEGTVLDSSGAAVPNAKVTVTNQATGVAFSAVTSGSGVFRVPTLPRGIYRVEIEAAGFKPWAQRDLQLEGANVRTLNPSLEVGSQQATVEVRASIVAVETGKSATGTEVSATTIAQAPLQNRNVYAGLLAMVPGITGTGASNNDNYTAEASYGINAAGQRSQHNEYQLDGTSVANSSRGGETYFAPQPDTVEAIKVTAAEFSAEKGRFSGAGIQVFTKSGTNALHGAVSEFHTNSRLQARTISQTLIPATRRNEFGGALGGPIVKNRTFFFGSLFGLLSSSANSSTPTIETPEFRQFIINQYPNSIAAAYFKLGKPLAEPSADFQTIAEHSSRVPGRFPVPASWPRDMRLLGTASIDQSVPRNGLQFSGRVDHNFTNQRDRLSYQIMRSKAYNYNRNVRPEFSNNALPDINWLNRTNWIHTITPSLLSEVSFSWIRTHGGAEIVPYELPQVSITSLQTFNNSFGSVAWTHNDFSLHHALGWTLSRHNLRFGIDIDRQRDDDPFTPGYLRPAFSFANVLDFAQDRPFTQTGPVIDTTTGAAARNLTQRIRMLYIAPFVQDDWKVTRNLTVNLGLRYDYFGHIGAVRNDRTAIPQFRYGDGNTLNERIANGSMQALGGDSGWISPGRIGGWGPRIGVGWDVFGDGKLALRGGWGLYYNKLGSLAWIARLNPPTWAQPVVNIQDPNPVFSYMTGPDYQVPPGVVIRLDPKGGLVGTRVAVQGAAADIEAPRTQSWMFSIQRTLGSTWLLEADYNGSRSTRLYIATDVNRFAGDLLDGVLNRLNSSFGFVNLGRTVGLANSHLATLMASKRFATSFSMKAMFSFGKSLDNTSGVNTTGPGGAIDVADWTNPGSQYGRANFDVARRLALESVLDVPTPWRNGVAHQVLGGWRLSTLTILQSGQPFSVTTNQAYPNGDFNADGATYDFPNAPSFGSKIPNSRRDFQNGVFTRADFPAPPRGLQGDLGRNVFTGPGLANVNASLAKVFGLPGLSENTKLEFRGELFNAFNRVNLSAPATTLTSATFGRSTTSTRARQVQFGARISF